MNFSDYRCNGGMGGGGEGEGCGANKNSYSTTKAHVANAKGESKMFNL